MRTSPRSALAVLLISSLSPCVYLSAQQAGPTNKEQTRPRRVSPPPEKSEAQQVWSAPTQNIVSLSESVIAPSSSSTEPLIRVALATNVRTGTISTTGRLMKTIAPSNSFEALNTTRVRVEARLLSPLPATPTTNYFIAIDVSSHDEAQQKSRELRETSGEEVEITQDENGWRLVLKAGNSRDDAEALLAKLNEAGFDASLSQTPPTSPTGSATSTRATNSPVRLVSRASSPMREVVASAPGAAALFSSSAPLQFASDQRTTPVLFNDKPYRGAIEVFANTRGTLTVVNVLSLEDYVRGVVANELSPGSYPALEALKAQAVAARTYALHNRGQFLSQGYDVLPTTRSQVYRGISSENQLSTRAVDETRGMVATYAGEPINALYTSTCGGRTENAENIFNQPVAYLRGRECAVEDQNSFAPFKLETTRDLPDVEDEANVPLSRATALLTLEHFSLWRGKLTDSWLKDEASESEVRGWIATVARLANQVAPTATEDINRPGPFATALNLALFGESRADTLLNNADVEYFLAVRDSADIPRNNRADVASLVKDGYLTVYPDTTLRPKDAMSRGRILNAIARILEARELIRLQKGTARPAARGELVLRSGRGKDQTLKVSASAFLFRQIGDRLYPVRSVVLVGGEPVVFHLGSTGEVDYLEIRPSVNGAAAERFSPFTNWTTELSLGQIQGRLARRTRNIGPVTDLKVSSRGSSRRVIDLEIIGPRGSTHLRGGKIRSALGLREQLFVIERRYDSDGRVIAFVFAGRGWGHGVGMCQVGAYGLARQGWDYQKILKAYYTGIELTRMY